MVALFVFFAACHFSQFYCNVPIRLRGGSVGAAYWPVLRGPMQRNFLIDAVLTIANAVVAISLALQWRGAV